MREGYLETIDNLVQADATVIAMSQINTQSSTRYIAPKVSKVCLEFEQYVSMTQLSMILIAPEPYSSIHNMPRIHKCSQVLSVQSVVSVCNN